VLTITFTFSFSSTSLGTLELTLTLLAPDATGVFKLLSTELVDTLRGTPIPRPLGLGVVFDLPSDEEGVRVVDEAKDVRVGGEIVASDERGLGAGGPIFPEGLAVALMRTLRVRALRLARGAKDVGGVSDFPSFDASDMDEGGRDEEGVPIIDSRLIALLGTGVFDAAILFNEIFLLI
jgi:hypothetical protein